jgi:hydroxyethylthiazole kinase-like uncharacterized protein yjeF
MRYAHNVDAIRAAEAAMGAALDDGTLMARAAAGLSAVCLDLLRGRGGVYGSEVALLVGSGSNGGDAMTAGATLARRGARVTAILLVPDKAHARGLAAFRSAGGRLVVAEDADRADRVLRNADVIIDGIVGIGGTGGLRAPADSLARTAGDSGAGVVAVDVPSGVDADTGEVHGAAVRADVTVTFGSHKPGLLIDPGAVHAGSVVLVDIGLGPHLDRPSVEALQSDDLRDLLPMPLPASDKYRRGVVGVLAGSAAYTGAAVLAVGGAIRGGAGMVRFVGEGGAVTAVRAAWPEAVVTEQPPGSDPTQAGRVQAWVIGPGHGIDDAARADLETLLTTDEPVIVDADALTLLAEDPAPLHGRSAPTLLTPHAGELARLLDADRSDVESRRLAHARRAADELGATVLLKGSTTLVAEPGVTGRPVRANATGTPWLATAGCGDVLAGLAGALLAGGLDAYDAGSVAAYLHGLAGRIAAERPPTSAGDVAAALPAAYARVLRD